VVIDRLAWKARRDTAWRPLPLIAIVVVACLAGGGMLVISGARSHPPEAAPLPSRQFAISPGVLGKLPPLEKGGITVTGWSDKRCSMPVAKSHLVIASLCVNGPIVPSYQQRDGALAIPYDVREVGMWNGGAQLSGSGGKPLNQGTTLLAGHVDYVGQGVGTLYNLYRVEPGAVVYVSDAAGHVTRWRVTSLTAVQKSELPSWVFAGPAGPRKLVLVTCGGPVEYVPGYGNTYRDNVIASAVPA
jgi:sortase family protein